MKKSIFYVLAGLCVISLLGCNNDRRNNQTGKINKSETTENTQQTNKHNQESNDSDISPRSEHSIEEVCDYKECFEGINGCAVFYSFNENTYTFYNKEMCNKQVSPCSTFKIISTLIGLKND